MTANERAATFIGWEPFREVSECRCRERPNFHPLVKVPVKCPNMALSANYMVKAQVDWVIDTYQHSWSAYRDGKEGHGANAVAALAALWDAEHGEPR